MSLDTLLEWLNKLYGLPGAAIVVLLCVVLTYVVRIVFPSLPNRFIPGICVVMGAFILPFLAPPCPATTQLLTWRIRNTMIGFVVGFFAWVLHKWLLNRVEDKLPWLGDALKDEDGQAKPALTCPPQANTINPSDKNEKNMKKLLVLTSTLTLLVTGCGTTTIQQRVDTASAIARVSAQVGSYAAITPPVGNASNRPYIQAAADGIGLFVTGSNASPQEFYQDLVAADPQLSSPTYQIFATGLGALYDGFYSQFVLSDTNANWKYVVEFMGNIQAGCDATLGANPSLAANPPIRYVPAVQEAIVSRHKAEPRFFPTRK